MKARSRKYKLFAGTGVLPVIQSTGDPAYIGTGAILVS
jgi:hypothetical protein